MTQCLKTFTQARAHTQTHTNIPSVLIWSIVNWNNMARRQTDGVDVELWVTQWTAEVWVWSEKKRKISPFRNAGVESLTSSVWSWCRVHVWPEWKVDIMLLLYWEWKHVELKNWMSPFSSCWNLHSCCIVQVVVVEVVNSHKQLKDILNLIVNKSNQTVRCSDDVGVLFMLWHFIPWHQSVKPVIIIIIIIIVVSCISRASMTQWKRTTACKSSTSLDKTTPRFVQNCFCERPFVFLSTPDKCYLCPFAFIAVSQIIACLPPLVFGLPSADWLVHLDNLPVENVAKRVLNFHRIPWIKTDVAWQATVASYW